MASKSQAALIKVQSLACTLVTSQRTSQLDLRQQPFHTPKSQAIDKDQMSAWAVSWKGWGSQPFLARMVVLWATKMSILRTQRCHCDLNLFFCNLQFVQAQKGLEICGTRSGIYLLIRKVCVCVFMGGGKGGLKEIAQDP